MDRRVYRKRRMIALFAATILVFTALLTNADMWQPTMIVKQPPVVNDALPGTAAERLDKLDVKGRAPKTGYERAQFGNGWSVTSGCDMRNIILHRDLKNTVVGDDCKVVSGTLTDPYTGRIVEFKRGASTSDAVQIDHVVALSNAWQTGAQQLTFDMRRQLANDPLELIAVEGKANQEKSDGDAATWLPSSKTFRCQYVARQIAVKTKYTLWVTQAEKDAMTRVLETCPGQGLPAE